MQRVRCLRTRVKGLWTLCLVALIGAATAEGQDGVRFVDVSAEVGVQFLHRSGLSDAKLLPETYGAGALFFDSDGDGDLDLYLINSGDVKTGRGDAVNRLYRNDGGVFTDITTTAGVEGRAYGMGGVNADVDNDGDQDLYLTNWGADVFYRNDGGTFVEQSESAGLTNERWGASAAFLDYDTDGDLDLYVANYLEFDAATQPWCGRRDMDLRFYCDPRQYRPAHDRLYRNEGEGTFVEVSAAAGVDRGGNGLGVVSGDFDQDGDADLYVANDMTPNFHYDNVGDGRFDEIGLLSGTAFSADGVEQAGMGVDAGDYDEDGDLDLFVTNFQLENNALYRNDGGYFAEVSFAAQLGEISLNYLGFGTFFFDYDNDGWLDLFVANGHVHDNIEAYDELVTYAQAAQVFGNAGGGRFVERTADLGAALPGPWVGRGSAFGDYDQDGDLDIALVSCNRPAALLRNEGGNAGHWLQVQLVGRTSNRDAVGARLYVDSGDRRLMRQVKAGAGYLSSSQRAPFFGLGEQQRVERLEVVWPSGTVQVVEDIAADQVLRLVEPQP